MAVQRLLPYRVSLLTLLGAGLLVSSFLLAPAQSIAVNATSPAIALDAAATTVNVGSEFQAQVRIADATNAGGWEADVAFNPYLVRVKSVDLAPSNTFLQVNGRSAGPLGPLTDNQAGTLALGGYSYGTTMSGANGAATLANVTFEALMPGITPLNTVAGQMASPDAMGVSTTPANDSITVAGTARYMGSGQTGANYSNKLALFNPTNGPITVGEIFVRNSGGLITRVESPTIPALTRRVIDPAALGVTNDKYSVMLGSDSPHLVSNLSVAFKDYVDIGGQTNTTPGSGGYNVQGTPLAFETQYIASGWFTEYWDAELVLFNPNLTQAASVTLLYTKVDGSTITQGPVTVNPGKRVTIVVDQAQPSLFRIDWSLKITSPGVPVLAELRSIWTRRGYTGPGSGGYLVRGQPVDQTVNIFSTGYNHHNPDNPQFDMWINYLHMYNPSAQPATVTIQFYYIKTTLARQNPGTRGSFTKTFTIPAGKRLSFATSDPATNGDARLADADYSTVLTSNVPILAQMNYFYDRFNFTPQMVGSGGFSTTGASVGANKLAFAEGNSGGAYDWTNYMKLYNPNNTSVTVTVTHYRDGEAPVSYTRTIAANSLDNYKVDDRTGMGGKNYATIVSSPLPILGDLALYWTNAAAPFNKAGGYILRGQAVP